MGLFSCFYDFVFFICREKGQKSVSKILYSQTCLDATGILVYISYTHRTLTRDSPFRLYSYSESCSSMEDCSERKVPFA